MNTPVRCTLNITLSFVQVICYLDKKKLDNTSLNRSNIFFFLKIQSNLLLVIHFSGLV